jgi:hypothetical protein
VSMMNKQTSFNVGDLVTVRSGWYKPMFKDEPLIVLEVVGPRPDDITAFQQTNVYVCWSMRLALKCSIVQNNLSSYTT